MALDTKPLLKLTPLSLSPPSEDMRLLEAAMRAAPDDETLWAAYQDACQEAAQSVPFHVRMLRWQHQLVRSLPTILDIVRAFTPPG